MGRRSLISRPALIAVLTGLLAPAWPVKAQPDPGTGRALTLSEAIARPSRVPVASEEKGETASQEA